MGRNNRKNKPKTKPNNADKKIEARLISELIGVIKSEVTSQAGKINLISDLIIAGVVVALFIGDRVTKLGIAFASIFRSEISEYLSSGTTLNAFILLVVFAVLCLIFIYIDEHFIKK